MGYASLGAFFCVKRINYPTPDYVAYHPNPYWPNEG
jgi:hypothetical protein